MLLPIEMLSPEQKAEYHEVFCSFDKNGDGTISTLELGEAMRALDRNLTEVQLKRIIKEVDVNGNGKIDFDEFLAMMAKADSEEEMMQTFRGFDKNGNGLINASELAGVMRALGERLTDDQIQEMMKVADLNGDSEVDYEEFRNMLFK